MGTTTNKQQHRLDPDEMEILYTKDGEKVYCPKNAIKTTINGSGREVMVIKGTNPSKLSYTTIPFNEVTAEQICLQILEGKTLTQICENDAFPKIRTVYRWLINHDDFREMMEEARRIRAEYFADRIIGLTNDEYEDKTQVEAAKMKFNALKWTAERSDPARFGPKSKENSGKGSQANIIINTGISRDDKPSISIEGKEITDGRQSE